MIEKMDMKSMDITEENVKKIQALFPNAVTEVIVDGKTTLKIDFDVLKQELSASLIEDKQERYQMTWPDKSKAKVLASSRITSTLRPDKEKSVGFDNTQNLYIEGDNLDVLKLLRETYLGKVKMIYIDPPYNTGNDFVYNDDFSVNVEEYMETSGQYDEEGNRLVKNLESNGRFHTDWLNMIYPRLKVAKDLLSDDGVIFISIDDNEVHNLKKICDEIFSSTNFVAQLATVMNLKGNNDQFGFAGTHEYTLVYVKNISSIEELNGIDLSEEDIADYTYEDEKGKYKIGATLMRTGEAGFRTKRPKGYYPIYVSSDYSTIDIVRKSPSDFEVYPKTKDGIEMSWRRSPENLMQTRNEFVINHTPNGISFYKKQRLEEDMKRGKKPKTLFYKSEYSSGNGTAMIKSLFDGRLFDNPKPLSLVRDFVKIGTDDCAIVMDFFSGSATTAHAVMQLNAEDGGNRKFIMVQLPEECDEKSEAYKAGYKTICEIGEERIRRAGAKIKEEKRVQLGLPTFTEHFNTLINAKGDEEHRKLIKEYEPIMNLDTGFRVLKLDSSNMQDVYYNPMAMRQSLLDETIDNVKTDRTPLDLLFQVMLDLGVELSAKIEEKQVNGKTYFVVNGNDLIGCFDEDIDNDVITEIAKQQPLYAVFKSTSFAKDSASINNEQLFKTYSPATVIKVL